MPWPLLRPRHWPSWLGVALLRTAVLLPLRWQLALGRSAGRLLFAAARQRRHVARTNIALCYPNLDSAQRDALLRRQFEAIGMGAFETAFAWWAANDRITSICTLSGSEHLSKALEKGRGVILLSAHFTTLELGVRCLLLEHDVVPMYRRLKNPVWDTVVFRRRAARVRHLVERQDIRAMLRRLRAGDVVWYAPDQDFGRHHSVFVPFMGHPAATVTATARLAQMSGAPVVPYFHHRIDPRGTYAATLLPALTDFPSGNDELDASRVNQVIEAQARAYPEQYLWIHRRFKTAPPGRFHPY